MEEDIKSTLKLSGHSATKTRLQIFRALVQTQPATMSQLVRAVLTADRATVYRTIDLFEELDIAKKIYTGFKFRIELGDTFQEHHHHLTCLRCGAVSDIHTPEIEHAIAQVAAEHSFRSIRHDFEITGLCAQCQNI